MRDLLGLMEKSGKRLVIVVQSRQLAVTRPHLQVSNNDSALLQSFLMSCVNTGVYKLHFATVLAFRIYHFFSLAAPTVPEN
jgi:hypothetical protein